MGQQTGRLPDTWQELIEERDRVLYWSNEVLARVNDNITNEDIFLMDYDDKRIDEIVNLWMANHRHKWDVALARFSNAPIESRDALNNSISKLPDKMRIKMRRGYGKAYTGIKLFTKRIDNLGYEERKIHEKIINLEALCKNNHQQFATKLGPLRRKVFKNLRTSEKMLFEEERLKIAFTKKVYDLDHKYKVQCAKKIDKYIESFENC